MALTTLPYLDFYSRGQQNEKSCINILVDLYKPTGIEFIYLANKLKTLLKVKVDLGSKKGVNPNALHILRRN